jgi:hypothetical protein
MLRSWLIEWFGAVEQQAMRTLFDQEFNPIRIKREGYLLVVAVRQVLRAVEAAQKHANKYRDSDRSKALGAALRKFDSSVPQAVDVRDVLVHFDRYQQGTGKLQDADTKAKRGPQRLNIYCSRTGEEVWLHLMPRLSIELGATLGATAELVEDVVAALD